MSLLGATTPAILKTTARVDRDFALQSFDFSLDPGTGPHGASAAGSTGCSCTLEITSGGGHAHRNAHADRAAGADAEPGPPAGQRGPGGRRDARVDGVRSGDDAERAGDGRDRRPRGGAAGVRRPIPAFKVRDVVRGPHDHVVGDRHRRGRARGEPDGPDHGARDAGAGDGAGGVEPRAGGHAAGGGDRARRWAATAIDEPRDVARLRLRLDGADSTVADLQGEGQTRRRRRHRARRSARSSRPARARPISIATCDPRPFIESDAPEIRAEAERMVAGVTGARARAERLMRDVNAPAREDARRSACRRRARCCAPRSATATSTPRCSWRWRARSAFPRASTSALAYVRGAFYYHAWPEVYLDEGKGRGLWLPVDPTFNQFPADATHVRLARGGLDKQAAILPLIGQVKMTVLDVELAPELDADARRPAAPPTRGRCRSPSRDARTCGCWASPCAGGADDRRREPRQAVRRVHRGRRRVARRAAGADPRLPRPERRRQDHHHPHDRRAAQADRRPHPRQRPRPGDRARGRQGGARLHPRSAVHLREAHGRRVPALPRRAVRHGRRRHRDAHRRDARDLRAGTLAERAGRELLARHEAAAGDERGVPAPAQGGAGRRADGRPRSARRAADQGRVPPHERSTAWPS